MDKLDLSIEHPNGALAAIEEKVNELIESYNKLHDLSERIEDHTHSIEGTTTSPPYLV